MLSNVSGVSLSARLCFPCKPRAVNELSDLQVVTPENVLTADVCTSFGMEVAEDATCCRGIGTPAAEASENCSEARLADSLAEIKRCFDSTHESTGGFLVCKGIVYG